jgi:hypothetical protein
MGHANWKVVDGTYTGTSSGDGSSGWLVMDHSYQNVQMFANFRTSAGGRTGVLIRGAQTPDGKFEGYFVSLAQDDLSVYRLVLDASGKELQREKLALPPPGLRGGRRPVTPPSIHPDGWNQVEVVLYGVSSTATLPGPGAEDTATLLDVPPYAFKVLLNGVTVPVPALTPVDGFPQFGSLAFFVGGSGQASFADVSLQDLNRVKQEKEVVSPNFSMQRITNFYYGWGVAASDIDHDGYMDIVNGPYFYRGPDFTERVKYRPGRMYNPAIENGPDMITFAYDFTGNGYPDILSSNLEPRGRPIDLYVNPRGESREWGKYRVLPEVSSEIVLMKDVDADGKPEIVYCGGGFVSYAKPDPADPTKPWKIHHVSGPGQGTNHGLGVGDISGDGRMDIIIPSGWFEQPAKEVPDQPWVFHPVDFGSGGAEMGVYDVNGDGLNDVVTSMAAHGFGLSWFEQKRENGEITFVEHKIMGDYSTVNAGNVTFSQPHATAFIDVDGDGIPDFMVGKRLWSHMEAYTDPDPYGDSVLYVYHTVRDKNAPGGARFVPELIHNQSGAGSQFWVGRLTKNGPPVIAKEQLTGSFCSSETAQRILGTTSSSGACGSEAAFCLDFLESRTTSAAEFGSLWRGNAERTSDSFGPWFCGHALTGRYAGTNQS